MWDMPYGRAFKANENTLTRLSTDNRLLIINLSIISRTGAELKCDVAISCWRDVLYIRFCSSFLAWADVIAAACSTTDANAVTSLYSVQ